MTRFLGKWRITDTAVWAPDYLDLVVPAHITFEDDHTGEFQFGTVRGWLDCKFTDRDGNPFVEFSWEGENDTDASCGRGWGVIRDGDDMDGHIFIHCSDDSAFTARRA
jgi:uncharacterized protein YndB with AHSA1/START domain